MHLHASQARRAPAQGSSRAYRPLLSPPVTPDTQAQPTLPATAFPSPVAQARLASHPPSPFRPRPEAPAGQGPRTVPYMSDQGLTHLPPVEVVEPEGSDRRSRTCGRLFSVLFTAFVVAGPIWLLWLGLSGRLKKQ